MSFWGVVMAVWRCWGREGLGVVVVTGRSLRRWTNSGLERVRTVEMIAGIFRFVVKLREQICGAVVEWSSG